MLCFSGFAENKEQATNSIIHTGCFVVVSNKRYASYSTEVNKIVESSDDSLRLINRRISDTTIRSVSLTGEVVVDGRFSEVKQPYQTLPNNYIRTSVNTDVNAFGLPLRFGLVYSSENNNYNKINGIRLGYSNETFLNNMRKSLANQANEERFSSELDSLGVAYMNAQANANTIDKEFASPEYQGKLSSSADVITNYEVDTINPQVPAGHRYLESQKFVADHRNKVKQLNEARDRMKKIEARQQEVQLIKQNNLNNLEDEGKVKQAGGNKLPFGYRLAMSVKSFDIGKFTPDYNSLLLDGTSLQGINLELNPGIIYGAFCYGSLEYVFNVQRPGEYTGAQFSAPDPKANVYWVRAGLRNGNKLSVILNQMISDVSRKQVEGTGRIQRNTVIGAEVLYRSKIHQVKFEMAQSTFGNWDSYKNTLQEISAKSEFNYAVKAQYKVLLEKSHHVDLNIKASYVAPDYFSVCAPFIRKDNLKLNAGSGASFFKKSLRLEAGIRNERDNFHLKAPITNNIFVYNFIVTFRYKALPYLQLQAAPGYNRMTSMIENRSYKQEFSFYSLSSGYSYRRKEAVYTLSVFTGYSSYMQLFASDSVSYYKNYQVGGAFQMLFKKPGIELSVNASVASVSQDASQLLSDSKITKLFDKCSIGLGYTHAKDVWKNTTDLYYTTIATILPFNMRMNIKGGYNQVRGGNTDNITDNKGLTIQMNITKKF